MTQAKPERKFTEVKSDFVKLTKPGDSVSGRLTDKGSTMFHKGQTNETSVGKYTLTDDEGKKTEFLGSTKIDDLLDPIPVGTYLRITYVGTIGTRGGQAMKDYKVEVAE